MFRFAVYIDDRKGLRLTLTSSPYKIQGNAARAMHRLMSTTPHAIGCELYEYVSDQLGWCVAH